MINPQNKSFGDFLHNTATIKTVAVFVIKLYSTRFVVGYEFKI